ncbi:hypothetical protein PFISCL1PPCAC_11096 [Pristionchus fissidentatus]|uniref:Uncharacterized protein n=1 Tax=Pristionchus fissidentatus TaxID=1538716 RepID=A0AAV5VN29_9BILA|nr:hypothetical protein PFISCL1PPCAC_11096 [Pristionchus fissidentatus]
MDFFRSMLVDEGDEAALQSLQSRLDLLHVHSVNDDVQALITLVQSIFERGDSKSKQKAVELIYEKAILHHTTLEKNDAYGEIFKKKIYRPTACSLCATISAAQNGEFIRSLIIHYQSRFQTVNGDLLFKRSDEERIELEYEETGLVL